MKSAYYWAEKLEACETKEDVMAILGNSSDVMVEAHSARKKMVSSNATIILAESSDYDSDGMVYYQSAGAEVVERHSGNVVKVKGDTVRLINLALRDYLGSRVIEWLR